MGIPNCLCQFPIFYFYVKNSKKKKKMEIPIFFFKKWSKILEIFYVSFTIVTKKVVDLLGIPNKKCGKNLGDFHVFFRGCTSNFWNSPWGFCRRG